MGETTRLVLAVNGGSSGIKFALFTAEAAPEQLRSGAVSAIGTSAASLTVTGPNGRQLISIGARGATHASAVECIIAAFEPPLAAGSLAGIVHRVVHGGERFDRARRVTTAVVEELRVLIPLAPNHLPDEIALIETLAWG